jgi:phospholipase D1/2
MRDDFSLRAADVREIKDLLSRVKNTLIEMFLIFLIKKDIIKKGSILNALTEIIYI